MVNQSASLDAAFAALADPTRRAILARLAGGETAVSEIARPFAMSLPAVLKHLDALERAGLLLARKDGRVRQCRLNAAPLSQAAEWIARYRDFWEGRLDAIDRYLQSRAEKEDDRWHPRTRPAARRSASPASSRRRATRSSTPSSKPRR